MNESKIGITERLRREGRWDEATQFKDEALKELRSNGMRRDEATQTAWEEMEQSYPPIAAVAATADMQAEVATDKRIHGLSDIPASWGELPANASLQAEIAWCQANRLRCVREMSDRVVVDLSRALSPAPSYATLGWLETSIKTYAKFVDVAARATASLDSESAMVQREVQSIDEVRRLLAEMLEG